jgi:hypothetical protein
LSLQTLIGIVCALVGQGCQLFDLNAANLRDDILERPLDTKPDYSNEGSDLMADHC